MDINEISVCIQYVLVLYDLDPIDHVKTHLIPDLNIKWFIIAKMNVIICEEPRCQMMPFFFQAFKSLSCIHFIELLFI